MEAIRAAEAAGYAVIVIDSLSHAWSGEGGVLDMHSNISAKTRNSFSAWREVTPLHNQLVDSIVQSRCHIIATMRSKTEYLVDEGGKKIQKVGSAPIQRDGMEYEFTIFGDLSSVHSLTVTKDRTGQFQDRNFVVSKEFGMDLRRWLESGVETIPVTPQQRKQLQPAHSSQLPGSTFSLVKAEKRQLEDGRTVAQIQLRPRDGQAFTAWAAESEVAIADLPPGTLVAVCLEPKGEALLVTDFHVVERFDAA